jgi:ankyrin repeat protein
VDLEAKNNAGERPIHHAFYGGSVEIVKLLLDKVDLEEEDNDGRRPIHLACNKCYVEIVKLLLDRVDLEVEDKDNWRPIHHACARGHLKIVKLLVDGFISDKIYATLPKVDIYCLNKKDKSPLDLVDNSDVKEYLEGKINAVKRTLFMAMNNNYSDIQINVR